MPTKCLEKQRLYRRRWYESNKTKQLERQKKRKFENKKWLFELKAKFSCVLCGMPFNNFHYLCDMHHKNGTKERPLHYFFTFSKNSILKELFNCVPLCSNCHRKIHNEDCRSVTQLEECWSPKPMVAGSSPARPAKIRYKKYLDLLEEEKK